MDYRLLKRTLPLWLAKRRKEASAVSLAAGLGRTAISDITSGKVQKPRLPNLARIAEVLDIPLDALFRDPYLDQEEQNERHDGPVDIKPNGEISMAMRFSPGDRDLPVIGEAKAGYSGIFLNDGRPLGWINRPPHLVGVRNAFAVYVEGDSMEPRYFRGELLYVNPLRPVRPGDFVLIELRNAEAFVKRFVRRDQDFVVAEQYNPASTIEFVASTVRHMYRIVLSGNDD